MTTYRDFIAALRTLEIPHYRPVIAHTSLSAFGLVHGGEQTILGALLAAFDTVIMPAFTYKTMVVPELGPPGNGLAYGKWKDANRMAEFFCPQMPVDTLMGAVAEAMRSHPRAERSDHPILSFCGVNAHFILETQKIDQPFLAARHLIPGQSVEEHPHRTSARRVVAQELRELQLPRVELADSFVAVQLDRHRNGRPEQEPVGRGFRDEQIVGPEAEGAPQLGRQGDRAATADR